MGMKNREFRVSRGRGRRQGRGGSFQFRGHEIRIAKRMFDERGVLINTGTIRLSR